MGFAFFFRTLASEPIPSGFYGKNVSAVFFQKRRPCESPMKRLAWNPDDQKDMGLNTCRFEIVQDNAVILRRIPFLILSRQGVW